MKKVLLILLGALAISGISVYATVQHLASDITYTPTDENFQTNNVQDALDYLYEENNKTIWERIDLTITGDYATGNRTNDKSVSIALEKGNYFILGVGNFVSPFSSLSGAVTSNQTLNANKSILLINQPSSTCELLSHKFSRSVPSEKYDSSYYIRTQTVSFIWKCSFENDATVTITDGNIVVQDEYTTLPSTITVEAIKLN